MVVLNSTASSALPDKHSKQECDLFQRNTMEPPFGATNSEFLHSLSLWRVFLSVFLLFLPLPILSSLPSSRMPTTSNTLTYLTANADWIDILHTNTLLSVLCIPPFIFALVGLSLSLSLSHLSRSLACLLITLAFSVPSLSPQP